MIDIDNQLAHAQFNDYLIMINRQVKTCEAVARLPWFFHMSINIKGHFAEHKLTIILESSLQSN
jgi:hypothetical protein